VLQNQNFDLPTTFFAAGKPGWHHSGIIDCQEITGLQQTGKVEKVMI